MQLWLVRLVYLYVTSQGRHSNSNNNGNGNGNGDRAKRHYNTGLGLRPTPEWRSYQLACPTRLPPSPSPVSRLQPSTLKPAMTFIPASNYLIRTRFKCNQLLLPHFCLTIPFQYQLQTKLNNRPSSSARLPNLITRLCKLCKLCNLYTFHRHPRLSITRHLLSSSIYSKATAAI